MDKIINWFILLLIFVFDPLAVALVIATNKVLDIEKKEREKPDEILDEVNDYGCLLYTSPSPRDRTRSRMPSSA